MKKINIPQEVQSIIDRIRVAGHKSYIVGGCVRDSILGRDINDWDICTSARPEDVMDIFGVEKDFKIVPVGLKHGTVMLVYRGSAYEVTTFRIDGEYMDGRRPSKVSFTGDIEKDLSRRDFTVNAMAYSDDEGLIDPFKGLQDIKRSLIRCVGDPQKRFEEDALRMLRAIRFSAQLGFDIEKETFDAICKNWRLAQNISIERIRQEFGKIMVSDSPSRGIRLLMDTKLMNFISPQLYEIVGFDQKNPYHDKDVFEHTMNVIESTPKRLNVRLAALFHDISKPRCMFLDDGGMGHFYEHDSVGSEVAADILKKLKYDNRTIRSVSMLIREHMINLDHFTEKGIKRFIKRIGSENLEDFFDLRRADIKGCAGPFDFGDLEAFMENVHAIINRKEPLGIKDLAIGGNDLIDIGYSEGKEIGDALAWLLEIVLEYPDVNTKEKLIQKALERLEHRKTENTL
ncbi:tRNA nucleotidyltransferase (CCA-adding enzyme) [Peptoclostridium litorale DSM 5388]|uniref:CCA-adding enzyme n=1 Tax=Peptoclostridium litorale DSM 5388 TaxID=1121324 RepID=A0A069RBY3_PEPLI|nr:CCA tRNA nucleotidyltransferase [Peptoclostridium litorale]KDR93760.1 CCA-adding enzyme [Peptoclostridium litorale DSM 5388]SIN85322.1 tRNA nucleotidyltransferase (CCA-adding enzyme) [Peptoclostridium litorale DSM 5388]